jgi:16S rRNA (adenine1518-N6/adenine1519-N6)-dimethyltransferase
MTKLGTPMKTMEILKKNKFTFQKKYGQNFLIDMNILEGIVDNAKITKEDCVLEIGPGIGSMTQVLAEAAKKVIAVEIDPVLIPILQETLSENTNVKIIHADILKLDIQKLIEEENEGKPIKVVANLPYYITTPIIMGLFEKDILFDSITVMVQKEVAQRMQVGPGTKDYGALSLAVQFYAKPEIVMEVSPSCFVPKPNVGSAVIRLERYENKGASVKDEKYMFAIIRASFNQRRKTLVNGLANAGNLGIKKEDIYEVLETMGLSPTIRGETFTLETFAKFSDFLLEKKEKRSKMEKK